MSDKKDWQLIDRKKVFSSHFVTVYQDKIKLPNEKIIDDYTVIEKPSIVIVVATDDKNRLLILHEYKYAAGKFLLTLPAGHLKTNEIPVDAAKRELLEETGFEGANFEDIGVLYDYPTKDLHVVHVVRVKNIVKKSKTNHEETESIDFKFVSLPELKEQIQKKEWQASSSLAALTLAGILS